MAARLTCLKTSSSRLDMALQCKSECSWVRDRESERDRSCKAAELNVNLEGRCSMWEGQRSVTLAQCGGSSARQCWNTETYLTTLSQLVAEPVSLSGGLYLTTSATAWAEMANRGYSGSNVMLVRNEGSNDMPLVAMLASCTPVALQG